VQKIYIVRLCGIVFRSFTMCSAMKVYAIIGKVKPPIVFTCVAVLIATAKVVRQHTLRTSVLNRDGTWMPATVIITLTITHRVPLDQ